MKVLAVLLLCAFAAVQGRSAGDLQIQNGRSSAALGENPWVVHLRVAVATSGLLNSAVGSLIAPNWVLTSSSAVENVRFIWLRYGTVNVINPGLVTESSTVRVNPSADLALIAINRFVWNTENISPIALARSDSNPESGRFCGYGQISDDVAGESLSCFDVSLEAQDGGLIAASSDDGKATKFDLGAPLVSDGEQVGVLIAAADDSSAGTFLALADFVSWIEGEAGLSLSADSVKSAPEQEDSLRVQFVN